MFYLKRGFEKSWKAIKDHRGLFLILILLQVAFIVSIAVLGISYQVKIINNIQNIVGPLQQANFDVDSLQEGAPFLQEMALVQNSFNTLKLNIIYLVLWVGGLFLLLQGASWTFTHYLLRKTDWKKTCLIWLKFTLFSAILFGIFSILGYQILKQIVVRSADINYFTTASQSLLWALGVIYYFLLVAFSLLSVNKLKLFFRQWIRVTFERIYKTLLILIINLVLMGGSFYLIYLTVNKENFFLMLLSTLLFIIIIVIARIFWIATVNEIVNEEQG